MIRKDTSAGRFIILIQSILGTSRAAGIVRSAGAQRMALEAAAIYADDEQSRAAIRRAETGRAFDISGQYLNPEPAPALLTVRDLEESLAMVRAALQAGIDLDRSQDSLKNMARVLLEHVMITKLERDRLVRIVLDNTMPLHLACRMRGLPYACAERILAVNNIAHPNFVSGEIDVYVR